MSGRAIILLVTGIIIICGTILYRIEAASTRIVENAALYHKKQEARNIAQTGVNLALRKLAADNTWRIGFFALPMLGGSATVTVFDTSYATIPKAIGVRSIGTFQRTNAATTAFCYFPQPLLPPDLKGLLTLNGPNQVNGNIKIDGRDHDPYDASVSAPGKGTYGIWTTSPTFTQSGSSSIGGTAAGADYAPANPGAPPVILTNQVLPSGFPTTPDSVFGGSASGYPEGTLKQIAQSGVGGSQYVTDPSVIRFPLGGVTYVEPPAGSPAWTGAGLDGAGILIVHNTARNAVLKSASGQYAGIIVTDDLTNLHIDFWGGIVVLTATPAGNVLGNGSANLYYSRATILKVVGMLSNGSSLHVIAWWE